MSRIELVSRARCAAERLFDESLSIDAHLGSMSATGETAVAGVTSGQIGLGETVTWRARHFGIWFTMTSKITELDRPHRFVDEQVRGPFRRFHHEHTFRQEGDDTVMTDAVTLASPISGRLAERLVLVPYVRRLLRRHNEFLVRAVEHAEGGTP